MKLKLMSLSIAILLSINAHADNINLNATAFHKNCDFEKKCDVHGTQDIEIINDSDQIHHYSYIYSLQLDDNIRKFKQGNINVDAHSTWNNHNDQQFSDKFYGRIRHIVISRVDLSGPKGLHRSKEGKNDIICH